MQRLWLAFATVMIVSFLILGWIGTRIYQEMPPIPDKFVTSDGVVLVDSGEIGMGQNGKPLTVAEVVMTIDPHRRSFRQVS